MCNPFNPCTCLSSHKKKSSSYLAPSFLLSLAGMEDSFRVRVDRVFGSLASSSASSSSLRSLWSLTDEEVERKEWNRGKDSPDTEEIPCSSSFDGFFASEQKTAKKKSRNVLEELEDDLEDLDDDVEDDQHGRGSSNQSFERERDREEQEIRSSIGLDCTLDNEEEEDEYDKVAIAKENATDCLYSRNVTDYEIHLDTYNVLPTSFKDATRDPRANHLAARIRLKEDEAAAASFDSFPVSDKTILAAVDPQLSEHGNLKSILKRKENQADIKSQKRVRFDPGCEDNHEEVLEEAQNFLMDTSLMETTFAEDSSLLPRDAHEIPDYIKNPSKYTHYSFDSSSEVDEESNRQAYMDFLNMIKTSGSVESQLDGDCADLSKSITFTPKKKASNASTVNSSTEIKQKESVHGASFPLGIAAGEAQKGDACAMDEDGPEMVAADKSSSSRKLGRQYRTKVRPDDSVSS